MIQYDWDIYWLLVADRYFKVWCTCPAVSTNAVAGAMGNGKPTFCIFRRISNRYLAVSWSHKRNSSSSSSSESDNEPALIYDDRSSSSSSSLQTAKVTRFGAGESTMAESADSSDSRRLYNDQLSEFKLRSELTLRLDDGKSARMPLSSASSSPSSTGMEDDGYGNEHSDAQIGVR